MKKIGIALAIVVATAGGAFATEFWTPEELARPLGPPLQPRLGYDARAEEYDAEAVFGKACAFIEYWQVKDPNDPNYGGIREGEDLPEVIQTDNTSESVWVWSRWRKLTDSHKYDEAVARSWVYINKNPAWEEEGWENPAGKYYRIYNCGWGMRAEMMYRQATGDNSQKNYGLKCARFVVENPIDIENMSYLSNYLCTAWAVCNLYEYAVDVGDADMKAGALALAAKVKSLAEEAPGWWIGSYSWAMSGGATVWGLHNSYFKEYPNDEKAWMAKNGPYLKTLVEPSSSSWDNAWNAWYMFGHHSCYHATGNEAYWSSFDDTAANLVAQDTDDDGGIPPSQAGSENGDHTWVTSYLCMMGMDRIIRDLSVQNFVAVPEPGAMALGWEPAFETHAAAYDLYRETEGLPGRAKITDTPLTGEPPYSFVDEGVVPGTTYRYWLEASSPSGHVRVTGPVERKAGALKTTFALGQNYPNPAMAGRTAVPFSLASGGNASFRVYDLAGREVYRTRGDYSAGKHVLELAFDFAPGVYVYKLEAGGVEAAKRMVIAK